jgi:hypothetical protein
VQLVNYLVTCFSYDHKSEKIFHKNISDNSLALSPSGLKCLFVQCHVKFLYMIHSVPVMRKIHMLCRVNRSVHPYSLLEFHGIISIPYILMSMWQ